MMTTHKNYLTEILETLNCGVDVRRTHYKQHEFKASIKE